MADPIRIFVGSTREDHEAGAEDVLRLSVEKHTDRQVQWHFMRAGEMHWHIGPESKIMADGSLSWNIGRPHDKPPWLKQYAHPTWWTNFTMFRYAIPELCRFQGRAIYFDVDMMVFADVAELWDMDLQKPWCTPLTNNKWRVEASVIDCSYFGDKSWWPSIESMKKGQYGKHLVKLLAQNDALDHCIDPMWNVMDLWRDGVKLYHFTNVKTQPWRPMERYLPGFYMDHRDQKAVDTWKSLLSEARSSSTKTTSAT